MARAEAIEQLTAAGRPHETQWAPGPRGPVLAYPNLPATLRELYVVNATDAEFLVHEGERRTFAGALHECASIAHVLVHRFGVRPGDTVAISMRNCPEWMLAFMAVTSIGAIAVGMNSLWQTDEMQYGLVDSGARVLFADRERAEQWASMQARPDTAVLVVRSQSAPDGALLLADELAAVGSVPLPPVDVQPHDPAVILYTSGSTGRPKGVLSSHRAVLAALYGWEVDAMQFALRHPAPAGGPPPLPPASLLGIPLFHVMGLNGGFLSSFRSQRRLVCMVKWDPAHAAELIERERVTSFSAPPAMTGDMVREAQRTDRDLSSLRSVGGGGAARPPEQVRQIERTFPNAGPGIGWGMTETNAMGTIISGAEYVRHPDSAGFTVIGAELRVVGDDGLPLPAGSPGELQVRGSTMFTEYWNRPDATADSFDGDWFRTGDVAYIDDAGLLFIVDRIKDLIIRGGENIGCGHVEAALAMHPHVIEAAVYSVPDERLGEEVGATVFGSAELDLDELRTFLLRHLARHEVPRYLFTTDSPLPRTASGKLFKRQVRDEAIAHL